MNATKPDAATVAAEQFCQDLYASVCPMCDGLPTHEQEAESCGDLWLHAEKGVPTTWANRRCSALQLRNLVKPSKLAAHIFAAYAERERKVQELCRAVEEWYRYEPGSVNRAVELARSIREEG